MASKNLMLEHILSAMTQLTKNGVQEVSSSQLTNLNASSATIRRHLEELVATGKIVRTGKARATRYRLAEKLQNVQEFTETGKESELKLDFPLTVHSTRLLKTLKLPLAVRNHVTYQRKFVDMYVPNKSRHLPNNLAEILLNEGRMKGQQPAGTYARKVLEPLLIDLSWSSSRLEGNRHTLLETEELFKRGSESKDADAVMLLNHKRAIEFLIEAVPEYGLTSPVIRNLHSLLMNDLLSDHKGLGEIRTKIVNISDTVYIPSQVPTLLEEMLNTILERAKWIKNPIEAAFFLWINIAYLQPFEDGNKRTSRLASNIPLLIGNCAPLSFLDVNAHDYGYAMMGVHELLDVSLAVDLFVWTYRRSIQKYAVMLEAIGSPDPFRLKYREQLSLAVRAVVREGKAMEDAIGNLLVSDRHRHLFISLLNSELQSLSVYNCARHRVSMSAVEEWIQKGRHA
jgi:Fic family protein